MREGRPQETVGRLIDTSMLPLSSLELEVADLADWLELNALIGTAGQASLDDLTRALKNGALGQSLGATSQEQTMQLEGLAAEVGAELAARANLAPSGYPFKLRGGSLERVRRFAGQRYSTYAFCLLLSCLPWDQQRVSGHFPERTFEEIACKVASRYLCGKGIRFGWPRHSSVIASRFGKAISDLSRRIGEGHPAGGSPGISLAKDAGLDVVAWRRLDSRTGKLLMFGACATGNDWKDKLTDLQPMEFCTAYLGEVWPTPAKAFFTPRIISEKDWQTSTRKAGMLFDRCRVSQLVPDLPTVKIHGNVQDWMETVMTRTAGNS